MYDLLLQPAVGYLKLLTRDLPEEIQVYLLRQVLPLSETYARKSAESEALLRGARAFLKSLECDSSSAPDPKAHSSPPDKESPEEDKSDYPWRTYSVTMKVPGLTRRRAVRLALAMGADHLLFRDPIPVAWLRHPLDPLGNTAPMTEIPGLPHEIIDRRGFSGLFDHLKKKPSGAK